MATKPAAKPGPGAELLKDFEAFYAKYMYFPEPDLQPLALACYAMASHLWPLFDAFPYLMITAATKRSGKTRLAELLYFTASNARMVAGATPATIFHMIKEEQPTLIVDEAEMFSSEAADMMRSIINVGYRRGQTVPRMRDGAVEHWPAYCPKVFVLIGDTHDTLRDRCIMMRLERGKVTQRFVYDVAKTEGELLRGRAGDLITDYQSSIMETYTAHEGLTWLTDRDAEIWLPLYAVASVLFPERLDDVMRAAMDLSLEKTSPLRRHNEVTVSGEEAEQQAMQAEYAERLVLDLLTVMGKNTDEQTTVLLERLLSLPTAPWRRLGGEPLEARRMAALLEMHGVRPKNLRVKGSKNTIRKGYTRESLVKAAKGINGGA